jgi:hypothetical protein
MSSQIWGSSVPFHPPSTHSSIGRAPGSSHVEAGIQVPWGNPLTYGQAFVTHVSLGSPLEYRIHGVCATKLANKPEGKEGRWAEHANPFFFQGKEMLQDNRRSDLGFDF